MSRRPTITCTQLSSYNSIDSSGCCVFFDCFFARQHQGQLNCYVLLFDGTITHTRSRFQTVSAENKQAGVSLLCVCVWVSNSIIGFFSLLDFLVRVGYVCTVRYIFPFVSLRVSITLTYLQYIVLQYLISFISMYLYRGNQLFNSPAGKKNTQKLSAIRFFVFLFFCFFSYKFIS